MVLHDVIFGGNRRLLASHHLQEGMSLLTQVLNELQSDLSTQALSSFSQSLRLLLVILSKPF
jgi:hypothetical protein